MKDFNELQKIKNHFDWYNICVDVEKKQERISFVKHTYSKKATQGKQNNLNFKQNEIAGNTHMPTENKEQQCTCSLKTQHMGYLKIKFEFNYVGFYVFHTKKRAFRLQCDISGFSIIIYW